MSAWSGALGAGLYPEQTDQRTGSLERSALTLTSLLARGRGLSARERARVIEPITAAGRELARADDEALAAEARSLALNLRREGLRGPAALRTFALVRELAERTLGLRPHDVQLLGGWVMLGGGLAEMETGEGKTLAAALPAATAALAGIPVHVVTVNDYLAERDAAGLAPLYAALGLQVGCVVGETPLDARRQAYARPITYVTNKELAFDYLKDRLALGGLRGELRLHAARLQPGGTARSLLLRGLHFAIVDEADSVLVDEARTPLLISTPSSEGEESALLEQALELAGKLVRDRHYVVERGALRVRLTAEGRRDLAALGRQLGGLLRAPARRESLVCQALAVLHAFRRDEHYLIDEGQIRVIDEYTGRVMADRSWARGIQQLLELKEGLPLTALREPRARISHQRFFSRFLHLAGMTGTASEVAGELASVYGLRVRRIEPHHPSQRAVLPTTRLAGAAVKWREIARRARELSAAGRPVLIGTRSIEASEHASRALEEAGLPHSVLNARQDADEAAVVARAGEAGRITVATNMAGRGTDIPLGPGVAERGGLHVILSEHHEAARIDRQLAGRCARQGAAGSVEVVVSLEDALLEAHLPKAIWRWASRLGPSRAPAFLHRFAQWRAERLHRRMRAAVFRADRSLADTLAFSGPID